LRKKIADITSVLAREKADSEDLLAGVKNAAGEGYSRAKGLQDGPDALQSLIATLTDQMMQASGELKFELAGKLRDEVRELKRELREMTTASA
jgi:excinuclease ABC subunit B